MDGPVIVGENSCRNQPKFHNRREGERTMIFIWSDMRSEGEEEEEEEEKNRRIGIVLLLFLTSLFLSSCEREEEDEERETQLFFFNANGKNSFPMETKQSSARPDSSHFWYESVVSREKWYSP